MRSGRTFGTCPFGTPGHRALNRDCPGETGTFDQLDIVAMLLQVEASPGEYNLEYMQNTLFITYYQNYIPVYTFYTKVNFLVAIIILYRLTVLFQKY